ncbi:hypothetical protein EG327_011859 [Venturia inaequalis]|uniref:Uncharacterized protein n=1 Tax=Venturia inaequalis TaxID=5025 RepID=A0A8H3U9I3_VENIN|nr:hypothetical protein EG327_011859 [Venturia inaequalis]
MCLAAPKDFAGFATVRFLLGFSEGAVSPAFVTITSYWYKQDEHAIRTALWISMNALAQITGSLLMYAIGLHPTPLLAPWRLLFLLCGLLTSASGILFYYLMPSGPSSAWFLSAREKEILVLRMAAANEGGDRTSFSVAQVREAMGDGKVFLVFWWGVLVTLQSPVLTFASLIIKSLNYTPSKTLLYTSPSGALQLLLLALGTLLTHLLPKNRCLTTLLLILPPLTGCILLLLLPPTSSWPIIASSWLASCITAPWSILLSLSASNVKGNTKRSVANAVFFIGYCAGCVAGPQLWTRGPRYFSGVVAAIVAWVMLGVAVCAWWVVCARENRRRDREGVVVVGGGGGGGEGGDMDLTDKQDRAFRYTW